MISLKDIQEGQVFLIDKPLNWTSFQVVNKLRWHIRKHFGIKKIKVGHAGTLDPLASGLLILCTGRFTKKIESFQGLVKTYTGVIKLGETTPSYDLETEVNQTFPVEHITIEALHRAAKTFVGDIDQVPPMFSAIQKDGKRLYDLARKGKSAEIEARKVSIDLFELTRIDFPHVHFKVVCSKGTYIRSLAHDFGQHLDSGAHLTSLRRTHIGDFSVEEALDPISFIESRLI